jgi:hypothetical protein
MKNGVQTTSDRPSITRHRAAASPQARTVASSVHYLVLRMLANWTTLHMRTTTL